jgi:hypothetical protein
MWARCSATCFSGIPTRPESSWAVCRPSRSWRRSASRTVIERSAGGRSRRGAATPPVYCTLARSAADLRTIGTALLEDRYLMEADPHRLLEGMPLAAYAAGASRGMLSRRARRRRRRPRRSSERSLRSTPGNPAARARPAARERLGCWTSSTASRGRRCRVPRPAPRVGRRGPARLAPSDDSHRIRMVGLSLVCFAQKRTACAIHPSALVPTPRPKP